jgi:hypothetical protein
MALRLPTARLLGLNGKAVLPMAADGARTRLRDHGNDDDPYPGSKRERRLVILLLALSVPCSAQLGVVMGMLANISLMATLIWAGVVAMILLVVGWLAARLVRGERSAMVGPLWFNAGRTTEYRYNQRLKTPQRNRICYPAVIKQTG